MKNSLIYVTTATLLAFYIVLLSTFVKPTWVLTTVSLGLTFGFLSVIIASRKLFFLSAASPHISLFTITLALLASSKVDLTTMLLAVLIGVVIVDLTGLTVSKGFDQDATIGLVTGLTTSLTVLTIYFIATLKPFGFNIYSLMIGDPLLTTLEEALVALAIAIVTATVVSLTYREQVLISFDRESARIAGLNTWIYDVLAYTLIGVNSIGLMKITGYILLHVLLLIPPSTIQNLRKNMWETLIFSVISTLYISALSLHLSVLLNVPPTGVMGLLFFVYYILFMDRGRKIG